MIGRILCSRRRWLALLSVIWIVVVYTAWMLAFSPPSGMAEQLRSACGVIDPSNLYSHAECLLSANQAVSDRGSDIAKAATLVAFLPVGILWLVIAIRLFLRHCRTADADAPSTRSAK